MLLQIQWHLDLLVSENKRHNSDRNYCKKLQPIVMIWDQEDLQNLAIKFVICLQLEKNIFLLLFLEIPDLLRAYKDLFQHNCRLMQHRHLTNLYFEKRISKMVWKIRLPGIFVIENLQVCGGQCSVLRCQKRQMAGSRLFGVEQDQEKLTFWINLLLTTAVILFIHCLLCYFLTCSC